MFVVQVSIGGKHDQEEDVRNLSATILSDKPSGSFDAGVEFPSAAVAHSAFDETKQHQKIHSDYNNGQIESRPIALEKGTPQVGGPRYNSCFRRMTSA